MRLIDADDLLTAFPLDDEPTVTKSCLRMTIKHMPTIDAEPIRHGHWVDGNDSIIIGTCSVCGWSVFIGETDVSGMPYCPNCGAKMDEEVNENETC